MARDSLVREAVRKLALAGSTPARVSSVLTLWTAGAEDAGVLNIAGMDAALPMVATEFIR